MDKIKPYLLKIKQYHFWILILVAVGALFYAWSAGTAELENSFKKNKSSIERQFAELKNKSRSRGGENFPNEKWISKRRELTEKLTSNGELALRNIKDVQKESQTWPQTLHPDSKEEINENRWTSETVADYIDAAREEIDRFRIMLDTADGPDDAGIFWDDIDFKNLKQSINDKEIKGEKACKIFQQILWVYEALVAAIQQTNAGAVDRFDLPIFAIKDTAVFQEAAESIDETAWMVLEDAPVTENKQVDKKKPSKTVGKKNSAKKPPPKFQPQLRTMIEKPSDLDGYNVIAFRIRLRMQIEYLESFLRFLANAPFPMILEGIRFQHKPSLQVVKTTKVETTRRTSRRGRGSRGSETQTKKEDSKPTEEKNERGTLVELWGFAYLAKDVSEAVTDTASARVKNNETVAK